VFGDGNGGNISVQGDQVELSGGTPEFGSSGFFLSVADFFAGGTGGNFMLQADRLSIDNGATIDGSTFGVGDGGQILIDARVVELTGRAGPFPSRIVSQVEGEGNGGDITIMGEVLDISAGANLSTTVFGQGDSGAINVLVDQVNIKNSSPDIALFPSGILSSSEQDSTGQGGDINLVTQQLTITEGGIIDSSTASGQKAGNITIQAQSVNLAGLDSSPTGIFSFVATDALGMGGKLDLQTETLTVLNGAQIVTGTRGPGNGNDLEVNANTISLDGQNNLGRSGLFANAFEDRGNGGTIIVQTDSLDVQNGATINASNFPSVNATEFLPGQGAAGDIDITANTIQLRNQGTITTSTFTGDQGNILLESDVILLRNNSAITTNASQTATGGNITILSDFLVAVPDENSDITANAEQGQGGRVEITTQGVYGLVFQENLTERSDITASSDIGLNGEVVINLLAIDPSRSLVALPNDLVDSSNQVIAGCPANQGANFVATGRGGLPDDLTQQVRRLPLLPAFERGARFQLVNSGSPSRHEAAQIPPSPVPVEARGWAQNPDGTVALVADTAAINNGNQAACVGGGAI
jgi:large exoprotein involved in heme utilization and adhesion